MKKIVLVRPYYVESLRQQSFPLGLGYLAAVLRNEAYWVRIYDLSVRNIKNETFVQYLEKLDVDYIGITALTYYYESMVKLAYLIKSNKKLNQIPLIIGGVHPSVVPELSLKQTKADYVVIGEGERTLIELLEAISRKSDLKNVDGIGFFNEGQYIQTKKRALIEDLDSLPFPAWDLIHPEIYPKTPHGFIYKKTPVFPIFTSRGCPFQCTYCASKNFWGQRIWYHSIKRVIEEISVLVKTYGCKEIHLWDDNFTLNRKRVVEFCREILNKKLQLFFACPNGVKIDTLDKRILKVMRGIGFYSLIFAVESGNQRLLNVVKKSLDLKIVPDVISNAKKLGYYTRGFFIFGFPTETVTEIHRTIEFANSLALDQSAFFIFTPLPGSTFFYDWIKNKDLDKLSWNFDYFNNPQDMKGFNNLDKKQIFKLQRYYYIRFLLFKPFKFLFYLMQ